MPEPTEEPAPAVDLHRGAEGERRRGEDVEPGQEVGGEAHGPQAGAEVHARSVEPVGSTRGPATPDALAGALRVHEG